MRLILIRHGIAEDRAAGPITANDDGLRALTKAGKRKMRRTARGLRTQVPKIDVLGSSPLTRAMQTAELVANQYDELEVVQVAALSPRKPATALLTWLQAQAAEEVIALVGHEPDLGVFASWLLTGLQESFVVFKKGGICVLELSGEIKAGHARLNWVMASGQLRRLR